MRSMTGFGRSTQNYNDGHVIVEMRSVNHKHLDIKSRHHGVPKSIEGKIRQLLKTECHRGSIACVLKVEGASGSTSVSVNKGNLKLLAKQLKELEADEGQGFTFDLNYLLSHPSVIEKIENTEEDPVLERSLLKAGEGALAQLLEMRESEGGNLHADIKKRLLRVTELKNQIKGMETQTLSSFQKRMTDRLSKLNIDDELKVDEQRLAQEIALMADKLDISEELVRLDAHILHFESISKKKGPVGRRLDFLLQEFGREFNTIASKSQNASIAQAVVDAKVELEKIREQVQNIE